MTKQHSTADFSTFSLSPTILNATEAAGYTAPTDIQLATIPAIMSGKDILARANTGSGKTAAFVLPLLDNLSNQDFHDQKNAGAGFNPAERVSHNAVQILVLVPTRELAIQIAGVFEQFSTNIRPPIKCQSVFGGVKINPQMMALRGGADVLVATPGRLLDLVDQNAIHFNQLKTLVIDEVDRLMKGDFEEEINKITRLLPNQRQNLMFTATFPDSIRAIIPHVLNNPRIIDVENAVAQSSVDQHVITVNHNRKNDLLAHLLNENDWPQVLIFCSAKRSCDNLVLKLEKRNIKAVAMHGNKEQSQRMAALRKFRAGKTRILIATDVAARGIDIEHLPCIINYDLPRSPNDYIHRIGRTARAGRAGQVFSLIAHHEYQHFRVIEKRNNLRLKREQIEGFEADEIAPPPPVSAGKKPKKRLSKKKRRAAEEQNTQDVAAVMTTQAQTSAYREKAREKTSAVNANIWGTPTNRSKIKST